MWNTLFENRDEWKKMNFSRQATKKFKELSKTIFDKKIAKFLEKCEVDEYLKLSTSFAKVYGSFDQFLKEVQGKIKSSLLRLLDGMIMCPVE